MECATRGGRGLARSLQRRRPPSRRSRARAGWSDRTRSATERRRRGRFQLVDSATTTAAKVERHLDHSRLRANGAAPHHEMLVTATPKHFDRIAANIFGDRVQAQEVQRWEKQTT